MAYEKTIWQKGDVIDAEKLNNIEKGIGSALNQLESLTGLEYNSTEESSSSEEKQANITANGNLTIGNSQNLTTTALYTNTTNYGTFTVGTDSVKKDTILNGDLDVTGAANLDSTVDITGNTTVGGTLGITGNTTVGGTLVVTAEKTTLSATDITGILKVSEINNDDNSITITSPLHVGVQGKQNPPLTTLHGGLTVDGTSIFGVKKLQNEGYIIDDNAIFYANTTVDGTLTANKNISIISTTSDEPKLICTRNNNSIEISSTSISFRNNLFKIDATQAVFYILDNKSNNDHYILHYSNAIKSLSLGDSIGAYEYINNLNLYGHEITINAKEDGEQGANGTVSITGNTTIDGTLTAPTLSGNTTIAGNVILGIQNAEPSNTASFYTNTAIYGNLSVNGTARFIQGNISANHLLMLNNGGALTDSGIEIPDTDNLTEDIPYTLQAIVSNGECTYSWVPVSQGE